MARYDDDSNGGSGLPWFLFGLGLGATLGLLFAPQSGEETRRSLARKAKKLKHLAEDQLEGVMDKAGKKARTLRDNLSEVADHFEDDEDEDEFEPRPSRAREELERRLAAARARRRGVTAATGAEDEEQGA